MKSIKTLVDDIYNLFSDGPPKFKEEDVSAFAHGLAERLTERLAEEKGGGTLRLSNVGKVCSRALWYSVNTPERAEPLPAKARFKFLYGDILEALVLFLARAAGHTVTDEQKKVEINGVQGHIDAKIDGELVDVKSASTPSFQKFAAHLVPETDAFGYLAQINAYGAAERSPTGHFLAIDKTLGSITLDTHEIRDRSEIEQLIDERRAMLAEKRPPRRHFQDEPEGKSGNRKLGVACSYCEFRKTCWPGLRTFLYSNRPVHLTHVERTPAVPELLEGTDQPPEE